MLTICVCVLVFVKKVMIWDTILKKAVRIYTKVFLLFSVNFLCNEKRNVPFHKFYLHMTDSIPTYIQPQTQLTFLWTPGAFNLLYDTLNLFMCLYGRQCSKHTLYDTRRDHLFQICN